MMVLNAYLMRVLNKISTLMVLLIISYSNQEIILSGQSERWQSLFMSLSQDTLIIKVGYLHAKHFIFATICILRVLNILVSSCTFF